VFKPMSGYGHQSLSGMLHSHCSKGKRHIPEATKRRADNPLSPPRGETREEGIGFLPLSQNRIFPEFAHHHSEWLLVFLVRRI